MSEDSGWTARLGRLLSHRRAPLLLALLALVITLPALRVGFRFRSALEDPGLCWLYWQDGRLIPFPLPAIGETTSVESGI